MSGDELVCKECGYTADFKKGLTRHINKDHKDIGGYPEYYKKYLLKEGESDGHCLWCGADVGFSKKRGHFNSFCFNKNCNVLYYNKNTNRVKVASENCKITFAKGESCENQIGYWKKKGFTEEEAREKVRERQTTNSVDKIMKREGCTLEEAKEKRNDITEKWSKSFKKQNYSKASQELFWNIYEIIKGKYSNDDIFFATYKEGINLNDNCNYEFRVKTKEHVRKMDFYIKSINKCIEFDGAYWHKFHETKKQYLHNSDKTLDEIRDTEIVETINCDILHIDELSYYKNKDEVIKKCIDFLGDQKGNDSR